MCSAAKDAEGAGYYVIRNVVKGIGSDDLCKFDSSDAAKLKSKVGAKTVITLAGGNASDSYAFGSRANIACDSAKVEVVFSFFFHCVYFAFAQLKNFVPFRRNSGLGAVVQSRLVR